MSLETLIKEGEEIRDKASQGAMGVGKSIDMEKFSSWVTQVLMYMDREITQDLIIEGIKEHSKGINGNTAYNKLIMLLGILKGYKVSI